MMSILGMASCAQKAAQQQQEEEGAAGEPAATGNEIRINCLYKVAPADVSKIVKLSKELVAASRKDAGNIDYDIYQSQTDKTQLMIFETWKDQASLDVHSNAAHFMRIVPQIANAAVGEMSIQSFTANSEGNEIRINCLLKVAAENVTRALGLAQELVEASRKDGGNIDYDLYQSQTDPTQLIIFETWKDQPSLDTHSAAEHFTRLVPQLQEMAIGEMAIQIFKK